MSLKFILDVCCDYWTENCRLSEVIKCKKTFDKFMKDTFDIVNIDYNLTIHQLRVMYYL